ncbi:MAG: pyridoxamine 5'-phosphate oxidase family protein [Actinomycetota bacterium]
MSDVTTLDEIKRFSAALSPWAHLATVGSDDEPDVVPVHPCWEGDVLWTMLGTGSVKARNVAHNNRVALHWQVTEVGDGVEIWGTAQLFDDVETKRRLWDDVFDYDLSAFAPGGPDNSPGTGFLAITPTRALLLRQYGTGGMQRWTAG